MLGAVLTLQLASAIGALAPVEPSADEEDRGHEPRHLLLVTIDTLRADHLGAFGYGRDTSPHLDRFAERAAVFERAYSTSSWTLPSVVSMMTSLYPSSHGCQRNESALPIPYLTLAERLAAHGFRTAAITSHIYLSRRYQLDQGFDLFDEELVLATNEASHLQISAPRITEKALAWLEGRKEAPSERWFLWLHYFDPHAIYQDHPATREPFGPQPVDRYDSEVFFTDAHLADLWSGLARMGLLDETLIVITADHGEEFGDHGGAGHRATLYEEVLRIPLLIRAPGIPPGRIEPPVSLVDVAPTVLELLAVPALERAAGLSLVPLLRGERLRERPLLAELENAPAGKRAPSFRTDGRAPQRGRRAGTSDWDALILGRWKLLRRVPRELQLYDIATDPEERNDLSEQEPERVRQMLNTMKAMIAEAREIEGLTTSPTSLELTDEELERLRDLGYVGDD